MNKLAAVLIVCPAFAFQELAAQEVPPWCQAINDFIKDVENGRSPGFDLRSALVDMTKRGTETVRPYSFILPQADPPEIMQWAVVDNDKFGRWEAQKGFRHLRVRPHSSSHWIEVFATAVMPDAYGPDRLPDYPTGGGFRIIFDSAEGSLDVGVLFKTERRDGKARVDQTTLSVRGQHCVDITK